MEEHHCLVCQASFTTKPSLRKIGKGRFCSYRCGSAFQFRNPEARFWPKVIIGPDCWLWAGKVKTVGYGSIVVNGRECYAHRFAWELNFGPVPDGKLVCHHCDNRRCVRPDHLFVGTDADNHADMVGKKRHRHGEEHHCCKLSAVQVIEIRRLAATGLGKRKLGRRFGVNAGTIGAILSGRTWKHL